MISYNCNAARGKNFEYLVWAIYIENKWMQFLFNGLRYLLNESNLGRIFENSARVQVSSAIGTCISSIVKEKKINKYFVVF